MLLLKLINSHLKFKQFLFYISGNKEVYYRSEWGVGGESHDCQVLSGREVVSLEVYSECYFLSWHGCRYGAVRPSFCVCVHLIYAETFLSVILECELCVNGFAFLDLSE